MSRSTIARELQKQRNFHLITLDGNNAFNYVLWNGTVLPQSASFVTAIKTILQYRLSLPAEIIEEHLGPWVLADNFGRCPELVRINVKRPVDRKPRHHKTWDYAIKYGPRINAHILHARYGQ
ncbi:hypothetical protein GWI33_022504 [Rhynchophorus ferrugineus]|uniref:Uncharacterized protein n=1 Tax=Rhynchophorus ferrugineus TaxID=354439 RepID=A0A834INE5_RHYFE|nr:hypothetical protein GWI33_022504 [Rhynchophorus ferrugineus]